MTSVLTLEDLQGKTEAEIIRHLTQKYGDGDGSAENLIAYESVGCCGMRFKIILPSER